TRRSDAIRSYFAAYKSKPRKVVEDALTDDFTFTSPYDDAIGKRTYFERCWPNSERIREHIVERIAENGDAAFVLYRCRTMDGSEFRNAELFTFAGDRVRKIDVYFGASYKDGRFIKQQE